MVGTGRPKKPAKKHVLQSGAGIKSLAAVITKNDSLNKRTLGEVRDNAKEKGVEDRSRRNLPPEDFHFLENEELPN